MTELTALLQLADAAFPAGAFAHSFGLETAIADGRVGDEAALRAWIADYLRGIVAPLDGAAFVLALRDGVAIAALDERLAAAQANAELRRGNAHLARATLASYAAMELRSPALSAYADALAAQRCAGQHVLAAALGYAACGIGWQTGLTAHVTTTVATLASVAARAVPLGQRAVAHARWALRAQIDDAVARAARVRSLDELAIGAPALEIDGLRHRRLHGRLFAS
ncbi:MAG TPA: urease accessory UreF family protein [Candidatus Sulfotelmatobacter sp.]|nr:urease accessory UreF family protein [Candidatus Sulfotelmatobacter sp.]